MPHWMFKTGNGMGGLILSSFAVLDLPGSKTRLIQIVQLNQPMFMMLPATLLLWGCAPSLTSTEPLSAQNATAGRSPFR